MSEWITDRRPTETECTNEGDVWVYLEDVDEYVIRNRSQIDIGAPWREIDAPPSYVKAKRWTAKWNGAWWSLYYDGDWDINLTHLNKQSDQHREAAERIAAIYEELYP